MSSFSFCETKPLILSVKNLCVTVPHAKEEDSSHFSDTILKSISFHMHSGDRIAIVGASGSGKTTLLKAIVGVLPHSLYISGSVCLQEGTSAYIMQEPKAALNPIRTVKNMFLALRHRKIQSTYTHTVTTMKRRRHDTQHILHTMYRAFETMNLLNASSHDRQSDTHNVQKLLSKKRAHMSGGMAQRIMVALTIATGSQWALADEVSSALDEAHERKTIELLLRTMKSMLFVTHRMNIVKSYCNKVLELQDGAVHFFGTMGKWLSSQKKTHGMLPSMDKNSADEQRFKTKEKPQKTTPLFPVSTASCFHSNKPILRCEGISARYVGSSRFNFAQHNEYAGTTVFQNIDFTAQAGEVVCIRGETGCGKSTFAHICSGYIRPSSGIVRIYNTPMPYGLSRAMRIVRRDIQLISQVPSLSFNPVRKVLSSVMDAYSTMPRKEKKCKIDQVHHLCEKMHIEHGLLTRFPHQLSGGQLQRISIVRALLPSPKILILDEPVSHLDPNIRVHVLECIRSIHTETGITLIMISHLQDIHDFTKRAYSHFTSYTLERGTLSKL